MEQFSFFKCLIQGQMTVNQNQNNKFRQIYIGNEKYNSQTHRLSLARCWLLIFIPLLSNPFAAGDCFLPSYLQRIKFPSGDISLIQMWRIARMPSEMKMITGVTGCHSAGPHRAAVMDIQMSMIWDIMICMSLSPAVQSLIVFLCLMRSCFLRHLLTLCPPPVLHSPAK